MSNRRRRRNTSQFRNHHKTNRQPNSPDSNSSSDESKSSVSKEKVNDQITDTIVTEVTIDDETTVSMVNEKDDNILKPVEVKPDDDSADPVVSSSPAFDDSPEDKLDAFSVTSLCLGILSFFIPLISGIAAIVFGILGLHRIKRHRYAGKGLAIGGILLGSISIFLLFVVASLSFFWYATTLYSENNQQNQVINSAATFGEDVVAKTTTGDQLPITMLDAERLFAKSQASANDTTLVQWVKTPGVEKACFVVQSTDGARAGGIVTSSQFVAGTPGRYSPLVGTQSCA